MSPTKKRRKITVKRMGATEMKSYDVTAVYDSGQTIIVKHSTLSSAQETIKALEHNAKIANEQVQIIKEWKK